jgi:hypothetical protein
MTGPYEARELAILGQTIRSDWIFLRPSLRRNHSRKRNVKPVTATA